MQALKLLSRSALVAAAALPIALHAQTVRPEQVGLSSERLERVGALVERHLEDDAIAGAVTLVARDGRIAHLEAHGELDLESGTPMQADSIFRIASMSKPVAAVAIMMLVEEGRVGLDDPVSRFIPEYEGTQVAVEIEAEGGPGFGPPQQQEGPPDFYTRPAERDITVFDLLTHTSGVMSGPLSNSVGQPASQERHDAGLEWIESIADAPVEFEPGSRWAYSALAGFDVLSRIVEIASGRSFDAFLDERVFGPLGMDDTFFWPSDAQRERLASSYVRGEDGLTPRENPDSMSSPRYFSGAGGLMTTAADYAQFGMMLAGSGTLDGERILSPRSVELMRGEHIPDTLPGRPPSEGYGLGVRVVTDPVAMRSLLSKGSYGWSGFYGTHFWVDPVENLVAVYMAQTSVPGFREDFETAVMQAVVE